MRGGLLPEALRRRLFCAIMEKTGGGLQAARYRTAPEKPVPKQEELNVKNTFSHRICAFAATSKAAIGFADRHKK